MSPKVLVLVLLLSFVVSGISATGQEPDATEPAATPAPSPQYPPYSRQIGRPDQPSQDRQKLEREQEKKLNEERQLQLKRDTDKLLELATQLKQAVDKSNEHTLSLQVMKKAAEIEKLAKSVREKMRGYN